MEKTQRIGLTASNGAKGVILAIRTAANPLERNMITSRQKSMIGRKIGGREGRKRCIVRTNVPLTRAALGAQAGQLAVHPS